MSAYQIKVILPDDLLESLPADPNQWESYIARFLLSGDLKTYDLSLQRRQKGAITGAPLSRYEKSMCTDLLLDIILGQLREAKGVGTSVESYTQQSA